MTELDKFLEQSSIPQMDSDLTDRIINEAQNTAVAQSEFTVEKSIINFNIGKRVVSFALILALGFGLGFYDDQILDISNNHQEEIIYNEGTIL